MIKVVIADDEEKISQLIYNLVDWDKMEMTVSAIVHDGIEALEAIKELNPDIVISDIRMPGYDGLEMIKRARELNEDMAFVIISGYQQFDYAKKAIQYGVKDYLLKPIKKQELNDVLMNIKKDYMEENNRLSVEEQNRFMLQTNIEKVRTTFFSEILYKKNRLKDQMTVDQINREYNFKFQEGIFQVVVIKLDGLEEEARISSVYIQDKFTQGIEKHIAGQCFDCEHCFDDNYFTILLNYGACSHKEVRRGLKNLLDDCLLKKNVFENFRITFGLGTEKEEIQDVYQSLKAALWAVEQRILAGTNRMIEGKEVSLNIMAQSPVFYEFNKRILEGFEHLMEEQIKDALEYLKQSLVNKENASGHEILQMCREALNLYMFTMQKNNIKIKDSEGFFEECSSKIDNIGNINEIFSYMQRKILVSLRQAIQEKKMQDNKPVRDAKHYIDKHYSGNLTLESVSEFVGFNPVYLSTLFKKETGRTFLEYLTDQRMSHAKELLRDSNMNVAAVCVAVGYSDVKYFTKNFKKVTGLKPNEYRKIYGT